MVPLVIMSWRKGKHKLTSVAFLVDDSDEDDVIISPTYELRPESVMFSPTIHIPKKYIESVETIGMIDTMAIDGVHPAPKELQ